MHRGTQFDRISALTPLKQNTGVEIRFLEFRKRSSFMNLRFLQRVLWSANGVQMQLEFSRLHNAGNGSLLLRHLKDFDREFKEGGGPLLLANSTISGIC